MKIEDIYGTFEINEPILIELINCPSVQRLKKINQLGVPEKYNSFPEFSRYEHSMGVMLLLRKLGASIEEQVAGLLHDVSHTAFSHTIDWIIGDPSKDNFQDSIYEKTILDSEIPNILAKHGLKAERIINLENFGLLEREIPSLCADRVDYSLRELHYWANPSIVQEIIKNLDSRDNKIVLKTHSSAKKLGEGFMKCQTIHWGSYANNTRYKLFSDALKIALDKKIITKEDFFLDDEKVMNKIYQAKNSEIEKIFSELTQSNEILVSKHKSLSMKKKFRYIDPEFLEKEVIHKLTESDSEYKLLLEKVKKETVPSDE